MPDILIKDCKDFEPLEDGTYTKEWKYCNLSLKCRQLGMRSDWYAFYNHETGEYDFDYFCTGMYIKDEDLGVDEEVS